MTGRGWGISSECQNCGSSSAGLLARLIGPNLPALIMSAVVMQHKPTFLKTNSCGDSVGLSPTSLLSRESRHEATSGTENLGTKVKQFGVMWLH